MYKYFSDFFFQYIHYIFFCNPIIFFTKCICPVRMLCNLFITSDIFFLNQIIRKNLQLFF